MSVYRCPAVALGCLRAGELRVVLWPGVGLADGGDHRDVPAHLVPPGSRMPNSQLWVHLVAGEVQEVEAWGEAPPQRL